METSRAGHTDRARRLLNLVAVVAIADFFLLLPLVLGLMGILDTESFVMGLGIVHGAGFVALVGLTGKGALGGQWGWWFPVLTIIMGGAVGSLIGDLVVRRSLGRCFAPGDLAICSA